MTDSHLYAAAVQDAIKSGCVVTGSCKPLANSNRYTNNSNFFTNENGIHWFNEVYVAWSLDKKEIRDVYTGTITIACKEVGFENRGDWHLHYGIKIDGTLELWAC